MKRVLGLTAVVAAVGIWAGVAASQSSAIAANIQAGLAMAIAGNLCLCLCLWLWYRAPAGSGDAMVLPTVVILSGSLLLGILPRLFWPDAEGLQLAGSIASMLVPAVLVLMHLRRRRRLRGTARPA